MYANSDSYAVSGGWALYSGTTPGYTFVDMYQASGSYSSSSAPSSYSVSTNRLYTSGWADTSGYSKILSISSTSIRVRLYRGSNIYLNDAYKVIFRFYT